MITNHTIAQSTCNLFYKNKDGLIKSKTYFKDANKEFYINGKTLGSGFFKMFDDDTF